MTSAKTCVITYSQARKSFGGKVPGFRISPCSELTATKGLDKDEKDQNSGKLIRRERYAGSTSRSFYVGEDLTEEDTRPKLEHGVLTLQIPKKDAKPRLPEKMFIAIEG